MVTPPVVESFGGYALALVVTCARFDERARRLAISAPVSRRGVAAGRQHRTTASADGAAATAGVPSLRSRRVVVVGGGAVAASKIPALLAAGGNVTVIAPQISPAIDPARVTAIEREFAALRSRRRMVRHRGRDAGGQSRGSRSGGSARGVRQRGRRSRERDRVSRRHDRARRRDRGVFDRGPGAGARRACCAKRSTSSLPRRHRRVGRARRGAPAASTRRRRADAGAAPAASRCAESALRRPRRRQRGRSMRDRLRLARRRRPGSSGSPDAKGRCAVCAMPTSCSTTRWSRPRCCALADAPLRINVGKRAGRDQTPQAEIERLMIEAAQQGLSVVRLKGGDPFVFGRGGEEALALQGAGIPFEIVPGVTTAIAAPGARRHSGHASRSCRPASSSSPARSRRRSIACWRRSRPARSPSSC